MTPDLSTPGSTAPARARTIYIASPCTPKGGGMYKVADYLVQNQARVAADASPAAELRLLDTRGDGSALSSLGVLTAALAQLLQSRLQGELAGVHVNVAERLSLLRKGAVIVLSRAIGVPVLLHLHAAQLHSSYPHLPLPLQALTRWVFSLPQGCVVLGQTSRQFVIEQLKVPAERVQVLNNGVPEPSQPRRVPAEGRALRVLFVGNLSERKGVSDLLAALAQPGFDTQQLSVDMAGGGDVEGYQAKARTLGLAERVRFTGWVDQAGVAALMANADVLVLPSYDEGLPLVILEALANGVAVVCSPVGEIGSVLSHDKNALLVQPGDVPGLALALQRVLSDAPLRQRLEQAGRRLYEEKFSVRRFFAEVARLHQTHFGVAARPADQRR
jgi:glycosyltransferase involved in cell wall biosynthesis